MAKARHCRPLDQERSSVLGMPGQIRPKMRR
jgi:hypothetical protein